MSSIDKRIVQMQFDNQGFERGVSTTMKSLNNLNESLKMKGSAEGLNGVNNNLRNLASIGLTGLSSGVDMVTGRFSALGIMGVTALMNITNSAVNAGKTLVRSLTTEPITAGFSEYETKMNAIQTILTNTASKGTTMEDVTAVLGELNTYADKTIFNFSQMVQNIGTFTAAGVGLEDSVTSIKGFMNLAAGVGTSNAEAQSAAFQLSQGIAAGVVSLQDWMSIETAQMGGELFQNELLKTAKAFGVYPYSSITSITRFFVLGFTFVLPLSTRETVAIDTPAFSEISQIVIAITPTHKKCNRFHKQNTLQQYEKQEEKQNLLDKKKELSLQMLKNMGIFRKKRQLTFMEKQYKMQM